jgi:hypothetical protein
MVDRESKLAQPLGRNSRISPALAHAMLLNI